MGPRTAARPQVYPCDSMIIVLCQERDRRMDKYRTAVLALGTAVMMLKAGKGTSEFDRLFRDCEDCRTACDKTRRELETHREEHGC